MVTISKENGMAVYVMTYGEYVELRKHPGHHRWLGRYYGTREDGTIFRVSIRGWKPWWLYLIHPNHFEE